VDSGIAYTDTLTGPQIFGSEQRKRLALANTRIVIAAGATPDRASTGGEAGLADQRSCER
jgi:hypothetical protein